MRTRGRKGPGSNASQKGDSPPPPLATAAALDSAAFQSVQTTEAIPATWEERAKKAWDYYLTEPLVKHCINAWRVFAIGDEIRISAGDEKLKTEAAQAATRLQLTRFVKDMVLQLLVKGDAVGFRGLASNASGIDELVCVNPVSVRLKYARGQLVEAKQLPENHGLADPIDLDVDRVLHMKWDAPAFSTRGNSMVLPAFQSIELLRDYRRAEQAIAKRWTTPLRLIKVGGHFGQKMVMPDQEMLDRTRDIINKMDLKAGLVVPFYVGVETHGTGGQVLNVEEKVRETKEDIMVALGLSRSLVAGDGPNFATASVSLQKMMVMIREIKQAAQAILRWVFDSWLALKGFEGKTLQFIFNDLDPTDATDYKRLLVELFDRGLISRTTLQMKMELDPETERENRRREFAEPGILDPQKVNPIVDMVNAEIMGVGTAQKKLGLDPEENRPSENREARGGFNGEGGYRDELCEGCSHFDGDRNRCRLHQTERDSEDPACRFFESTDSVNG